MADETLTDINIQLEKFLPSINKTRDFAKGEDEVKNSPNSELYLPKLAGQRKDTTFGQADYDVYKQYAEVFPSVGRTEESYIGIAFRKDPLIETPDDRYKDDFTLGGQSVTEFAKEIFKEVLETNRPVILVDIPSTDESEEGFISRDDTLTEDRSFATLYSAENVLDWDEKRENGILKTVFVKLKESKRIIAEDMTATVVDIIRVLDIDSEGYYRVRVYTSTSDEGEENEDYTLSAEIYPEIKGSKMEFIPVFPVSPSGHNWDLNYPPLNDLTNIAQGWYRNSASYENGLLLAGSPTLMIKGLLVPDGQENTSVKVGAGAVLNLDTEGGDAKYIQIGSDGLSEIKRAMEDKKKEMAVIGARILGGDTNGVEAAETAMIHRAGEHSVIINIGKSISGVLTEVMKLLYQWDTGNEPSGDDLSFRLNIDFDFSKLDPQQLTALMAAVQSGSMSKESYFYNLERGEMYPPNTTFEEEQKNITGETGSEEGITATAQDTEIAKLSGIQISSANEIIGKIVSGELTKRLAITQLKTFFGYSDAQANDLIPSEEEIKELRALNANV